MDWFRFYNDTLENEKVQELAPELYKAWVNLLCIARRFDGILPALPKIAFQLHTTPETAGAWVTALIDRRLFDQTPDGVRPHDWDEHQYDSDDSAKRKRIWRSKTKRTGHGTGQSRARADTDTEVKPSGFTEKPPLTPTDIEQAREILQGYPRAKEKLGHGPDDAITVKCLRMAGSVESLARGLRDLYQTGKTPSLSWAWFPKVLESYLGLNGIDRRRA